MTKSIFRFITWTKEKLYTTFPGKTVYTTYAYLKLFVFFFSGLSLSCYICYSNISWKDCFNKSTVDNCKPNDDVCSNTFTAMKQKDDQQILQFTALCLPKVGWRVDLPCDILFHLVGLAHAHNSANDFWKFFINFSKAVDANAGEFLLGIMTILPFPMCVFFFQSPFGWWL